MRALALFGGRLVSPGLKSPRGGRRRGCGGIRDDRCRTPLASLAKAGGEDDEAGGEAFLSCPFKRGQRLPLDSVCLWLRLWRFFGYDGFADVSVLIRRRS